MKTQSTAPTEGTSYDLPELTPAERAAAERNAQGIERDEAAEERDAARRAAANPGATVYDRFIKNHEETTLVISSWFDIAGSTEVLTDGIRIYDVGKDNLSAEQLEEHNRILDAGAPYLTEGAPLRIVPTPEAVTNGIPLLPASLRGRAVVLAQAVQAFEKEHERKRALEAHKKASDHLRRQMKEQLNVVVPETRVVPEARDYKPNDNSAANILRVHHEGLVFQAGNGQTGGLCVMTGEAFHKCDPGEHLLSSSLWHRVDSPTALGRYLFKLAQEEPADD